MIISFINLASVAMYFFLLFSMPFLPLFSNITFNIGFFSMYFILGYILDYFTNKKMKIAYTIIILINIIGSTIMFFTKNKFPIISFFIGGSFAMASTNLIKILARDYMKDFPFFMNLIAGITWILIMTIIHFQAVLFTYANYVFYVYIACLVFILLVGFFSLYADTANIPEKNDTTVINVCKNIFKDTNFLISFGFVLLIGLTCQYFWIFNPANQNIFLQLFGSTVSALLFYFIFGFVGIKKSMLWTCGALLLMMLVPHQIASLFTGIALGNIFIAFIYAFMTYQKNIGIIFSIFNVCKYLLTFIVFMLIQDTFLTKCNIRMIMCLLVTIYGFVILYKYK